MNKQKKISEENVEVKDDVWETLSSTKYWDPEREGDQIVGELCDVQDGKFGKSYYLKTSEGVVGLPSHKALIGQLREAELGDVLRVTYKGDKDVGKGNPLKLYEVARKKEER